LQSGSSHGGAEPVEIRLIEIELTCIGPILPDDPIEPVGRLVLDAYRETTGAAAA
jgi:hypothetical protein